jgi:hypothetical protein
MTNGMRGTEVAHHFSILDNEISESAELLNEQKYSRIILITSFYVTTRARSAATAHKGIQWRL